MTAHGASTDVIHKSVWIEKFQQKVPTDLCLNNSYLRQCHDIDANECMSVVKNNTHVCLNKFSIPTKVEMFGNGIDLAAKIGKCIGQRSVEAFKSKSNNKPICSDAYAWME